MGLLCLLRHSLSHAVIVDIYMPDFKFWDLESGRRYAKAPDYPEAARRAIKEMHRQVGTLVIDEQGVALRGVLLRHLIMPGGVAGTREIMNWISRELGPRNLCQSDGAIPSRLPRHRKAISRDPPLY
jgi:uncharacterized Fe-S radical SAM superfamily protein PflX